MICRDQLTNPNEGITGGHNNPNPEWCDCRQGECVLDPNTEHNERIARGDFGGLSDELTVLGFCPHGIDLDRSLCEQGCRV